MKRSKFSEEQIACALRQAESGTAAGDVCRQLGVSEATFYVWKTKSAHLSVSELRRMRSREEKNTRWKQSVAAPAPPRPPGLPVYATFAVLLLKCRSVGKLTHAQKGERVQSGEL